jgi:hypothetical protein
VCAGGVRVVLDAVGAGQHLQACSVCVRVCVWGGGGGGRCKCVRAG